jgi:hypothetical protein
VHYPKGIYVPNMLAAEDGTPIHPRRRIVEKLQDEDIVHISLKNRAQKHEGDEKEWYDKAFGPK